MMKVANVRSARTKQCKFLKNLFTFIHYVCLFGPLAYFIPLGYLTGEPVQKISISLTVITAVILAMISIIVSTTARAGIHRSILWVLMLGLFCTLSQLKIFITVMALTSILDELVFCRLKDYYKEAFRTNKEIDRRQ